MEFWKTKNKGKKKEKSENMEATKLNFTKQVHLLKKRIIFNASVQ